MKPAQPCATCGDALPPDAPSGACPRCAFDGAIAVADLTGQTFADYELLDPGRPGGMGLVYRARQKSLNRVVALKMIRFRRAVRPEDVRRFRTEVEAAAALDHEHIVRVYEAGEYDGQPYYTMQWMDGGDLLSHLHEARHQPGFPRRVAAWMSQIARAVHHAHQRGVLHRDLKPANLLMDREGRPHVSDFGLAKIVTDTPAADGPAGAGVPGTASQSVFGTPAYMSPEQAQSSRDVTIASDTCSLGAILYHLLTDRPPFQGDSPSDVMMKVRFNEPVPPRQLVPETDRDLETICLKCLEKEPARRYASAEAFAEDLDRWLRGEPIEARPVSQLERLAKWVRRHKAIAAAVTAAMALLVITPISLWQKARATHAEQTAKIEAAKSEETVSFLSKLLLSVSPEQARGRDTRLLAEILNNASKRVDTGLTNQPEVAALIRDVLASTYRKLGLFSNAQHHAELALAFRERTQGTNHPNTLVSRFTMAMLQLEQNRPAQAEEMMLQTLKARQRVFGREHTAALEAMNGMAAVYSAQGKLANSEALLRQAVPVWQRIAPDDPEGWRAMNHLGVVRYRLNDLAEAETWFRRVLEAQQRVLGEDHPDTLSSLNNLAGVYFALTNLTKAEEMIRRVLASELRVRGPEHQSTLRAKCNLANACFEQGKWSEAETLAREAWDVQRRVLAPGHSDTVRSLKILINACDKLKKQTEVETLLRELEKTWEDSAAVPRAVQSGPSEKPDASQTATVGAGKDAPSATGASKTPLANVLRMFSKSLTGTARLDELYRAGKYAEAEPHYREAVRALAKDRPETDEDLLSLRASLARCLADWAWRDHTNGVAADVRRLTAGDPPQPAPATIPTNQSLVTSAATTPLGRAREAEQILRNVLAIRERDASGPLWRTADVSNRLGFVLVVLAVANPALTQTQRGDQLRLAEKWIDQSGYPLSQNREIHYSYRRDLIIRFIRLYEAWDAVNPGTPKVAAALAKWRKNLADFDRAGAKASKNTSPTLP